MKRVGMLGHFIQDGVASFVIGGLEFIFLGKSHAATFTPPTDFITGLLHFGQSHRLDPFTSRKKSGLID